MTKLYFKIIFISLLFTLIHSISFADSTINQLILEGAKKELKNKTKYCNEMLKKYYPPRFRNGKNMNKNIYPNGDVDPNKGVCTDLIVRAVRNAGLDLQKLVYRDVKRNRRRYGRGVWPDRFIDHRRVWILLTYFKRKHISLPVEITKDYSEWRPGDIVIWDTGAKEHLHIGVVSDRRRRNGRPYIIHNAKKKFPFFPGRTKEQDILRGIRFLGILVDRWKILGHFRLKKPKIKKKKR